jgi:hypothetical protein
VQLHWRHMALLSRGWPEAMSARAGEAKELSRLLGEDHDYSVLLAFVGELGESPVAPAALATLTERCRACQADLRAQARPRGERLFAERADDLKERVALYWTSAGRLAALAPADVAPTARRGVRPAAPGKLRSRRAAKASSKAGAK